MITLYHGSYIAVSSPLVKVGRKMVDFGQGFYLNKIARTGRVMGKNYFGKKGTHGKTFSFYF